MEIIKDIQEAEKVDNLEAAQKAKIKWAIEGNENTKFYHGILNKKHNQLGIRGVLKGGIWIDNPVVVKKELLEHFSTRFQQPRRIRPVINIDFPCTIRCSGGGSTFFTSGNFPKGCNSSFIALIPKIPDAKLVKDFCPISLIGSLYKIIEKTLANRLVGVLGDLVSEVQLDFVVDRQILDGDVLNRFGFGAIWCGWIQECLRSSRGSVLVNGSPTEEFQFYKGLKQGDSLSPFLFILVMESLYLYFKRIEDARMFNGIKINSFMTLSHMFYADDAIFIVASARRYIDNNGLPDISSKTRWIKEVSIKVNVHAWKVRINGLPNRWNISHRGIDIPSILCPLCETGVESSKTFVL
uniref:RNA-directed DNA polymerase, eukaryota n=1 Tax=Tanacetum cinerariifolium TaxID=118510 RepID=A0A6L2LS18_TANCI|nr:RNA-directed DNA polymerase, eukaryota [Tanacetum cinerariifolium]